MKNSNGSTPESRILSPVTINIFHHGKSGFLRIWTTEQHQHTFKLSTAAGFLDVSRRTIQRWQRAGTWPEMAICTLLWHAGFIADADFKGYRVHSGRFTTPTGREIRPGTVDALTWLIQENHSRKRAQDELQRENQRLKDRIDALLTRHGITSANDNYFEPPRST